MRSAQRNVMHGQKKHVGSALSLRLMQTQIRITIALTSLVLMHQHKNIFGREGTRQTNTRQTQAGKPRQEHVLQCQKPRHDARIFKYQWSGKRYCCAWRMECTQVCVRDASGCQKVGRWRYQNIHDLRHLRGHWLLLHLLLQIIFLLHLHPHQHRGAIWKPFQSRSIDPESSQVSNWQRNQENPR